MLLHILQKKIKYFFKNQTLLKISLTHRSYNSNNNERLEFLGDSLLNFILSHFLYNNLKRKCEGNLSYIRSFLVNKKTLFNIAIRISLPNFLYLGYGELKSGGKFKISILANTLEALIGAIYLDSDFFLTKRVVYFLYKTFIKNFIKKIFLYKDYKTKLQEILQKNKISLPIYKTIIVKNFLNYKIFNIKCYISFLNIKTYGKGKNKQEGEQNAAAFALKKINRIL